MNPIPFSNQDVMALQAQNLALQDKVEQLQSQLQRCQYQADILGYVQDAIIATDANLIVTLWNAAATQMYGWSTAEALGRPVSELLGSLFTPEEREQAFQALQINGSYITETIHHHKDGHSFYIEGKTIVLKDEQQQTTGFVSVNRDISGRKQIELALRENESRYRAIAGLSSDFAYLSSVEPGNQLVHIWASENLTDLIGYHAEEVSTPEAFMQLFHPDDFPIVQQRNEQLLKGQPITSEFRMITKQGTVLWMRDNAEPVWDEAHSQVIGMRGAVQNITQYREAELALKKSEWRYRTLTELTSDVAFMARLLPDSNFQLEWLSTAGYNTLCLETGQTVTLEALGARAHPDDLPALLENLSYVLKGDKIEAEFRFFNPLNEIVWIQLQIEPVWDETTGAIMGLRGASRDVTPRKTAEIIQRRYATRLEILNTINQSILNAQTMFQIALATVTHLQAFFQCYQIGIVAFDLDRDEGTALARVKQGQLSIVPNTRFPLRAGFPILDELLERKTVWRENLPELYAQGRLSPSTVQWLAEGVHTLINIPIFYQADLIGSLNISLLAEDQFSLDDLEVAKEVADQLGVSIQQARLHEATEQQLRELKVLYAVTAAASDTPDENAFITTVTQLIYDALGLEEVGFLLVDEAAGCLRPHSSYLVPPGTSLHTAVPLGEGITGWVATHSQSRYVPDVRQEPGYLTDPDEIRSEYCVPLRIADQIIGVLNVESNQLDAIQPRDQQLLTAVAQQVAQTVQWLRSIAGERRWIEQQTALSLMGQTVTSSLDLHDVLQRILDQSSQLVEAEGIAILLPEANHEWLYFAALAGPATQHLLGFRMPADEGVAGAVMQSGQSQQIHQFVEGVFFETPGGLHVETLFALPLQMGDQTIGVLEAAHSQPFAFSELDYRTLQAAAAWASIAITNANTFSKEREARQQAETLRLLATILNSTLNHDDLLQEILQQLHWVVDYDAASIMLLQGDVLMVVAHHTAKESTAHLTQLSLPQLPHIRRMFAQKTPLIMNDTSQSQEWQRLSGSEAIRAWLGVPLVVKGVVIGLLNLDKFETNFYTWDDAALVNSFANQAAIAIENARLFAAEHKARQVAETLQAANLILSKHLDLGHVLENMLEYLLLLVPFDQASVILPSAQEMLECYVLETTKPEISQQYLPHLPLIDQVLNRGEGVLVSDTQTDPHWVMIPGMNNVACWMGVPLVAGGKTVGLYAISKRTPYFFTQEHYKFAAALAGQAAIAIQNALLYEAEQAQFRKLQESQSRLIQVEKLSALGRLTASIAHEINNPIQAVQGCLTLAQEEFNGNGSPETVNFYLGIVQTEIDRVATIVRRMRDFYRPAADEVTGLTDLLSTIESVLSLTNKQLESNRISLIKEWEPDFPYVKAKPQQLKQVFLNIILNALEAMPHGGTLRIRASVTQIRLKEGDEDVAAACLEFNNSGNPIPPGILQQLFEPFFTTKERGSGLGLSVSYSIVKAHDGEMTVTSDAQHGTTFTVMLPLDASVD